MNLKSIISEIIPEGIKRKIRKIFTKRGKEKAFLKGYEMFLQTGKTPNEAHMALIDLYCLTNGEFNESFNKKIGLTNPPINVDSDLSGVVGSFSLGKFADVNFKLNQKGYFHFDKKLSKEFCEKLYQFSLVTPTSIQSSDKKVLYDSENPMADAYRFDMQDVINNPEIQQLVMDPVLLNIARNYLNCEPIFDFVGLMWTTAFMKEPSARAAQLYHFDMDRVKWLKVFIYINEVTLENGPHCYIEGSHKPGNKPDELLQRGYARIKDEELLPLYRQADVKIVCGEAGSIMVGDTKCWHKGQNLKNGHRLILDFEYTSSLFGANYPKLAVKNSTQAFKDFCKKNRIFASNIDFQ